MPNGRFSPVAKTSLVAGLVAPSALRRTRMRPELVSTTKISPLGAVRIIRGPLSPLANSSTLKPAGTCGTADAGRDTTRDELLLEGVAPGLGKSCGVIRRTVP